MPDDCEKITGDFDGRASNDARSQWHRACAEGLVAHSPIAGGSRVLDAGCGTGFAALAAAKRVGPDGCVLAVDISSGMLESAREAVGEAKLANVESCRLTPVISHNSRPHHSTWCCARPRCSICRSLAL